MKPQNNDTLSERETLSALYDGELPGEARLFAMRRLAHDAEWQADTGRWQLIGDAMRRQAPIAAPSDFAERVRREVAAAPASLAVAPVSSASNRRPMRLWIGGALAASLALVTVLAVRAPQDTAAPVQVAASAPDAVPAPSAALPPTARTVAVETAPSTTAQPIQVAVADPEQRRVTPARPARRAATRASTDVPQAGVAAVLPTDAANPFHVPATDPLSSRPWPRASLPGTSGAFTASYGGLGEARGESPSFYPFEPRLQDGAGVQNESP